MIRSYLTKEQIAEYNAALKQCNGNKNCLSEVDDKYKQISYANYEKNGDLLTSYFVGFGEGFIDAAIGLVSAVSNNISIMINDSSILFDGLQGMLDINNHVSLVRDIKDHFVNSYDELMELSLSDDQGAIGKGYGEVAGSFFFGAFTFSAGRAAVIAAKGGRVAQLASKGGIVAQVASKGATSVTQVASRGASSVGSAISRGVTYAGRRISSFSNLSKNLFNSSSNFIKNYISNNSRIQSFLSNTYDRFYFAYDKVYDIVKPSANSLIKNQHINELLANGIKFNQNELIGTLRLPGGKIAFLEKGTEQSGLAHIIKEHSFEFAQAGVTESQIPNVVLNALKENKIIGFQSPTRPIYATTINGKPYQLAITVSDNGYIVGVNPKGKVKFGVNKKGGIKK